MTNQAMSNDSKEWKITIPLIWWNLNIHNKEQWDITYANNKPIRPKLCIHLEKPYHYCKRLFFIH